ncbi:MAG: 6-bladed beta-propeller [Tannerella sp.]|nr:6-bladed beta-propeller [Tannerella sp.]
MKKEVLFLVFPTIVAAFSLLFCTCTQSKKTQTLQSITPVYEDSCTYYLLGENTRIAVPLDNPQQPSITDYFKQVELIPLETRDDVLIGKMTKLVFYQGRYYTLDRQQNIVHVFDEHGKFIFKIDNKGQGPGQYSVIYDIIINPFIASIELLDPMGVIQRYDLSGEYKETVRVKSSEIRAVHRFISLDDHTYVFYGASQPLKVIGYDMSKEEIIFQAFEEQGNFNIFSSLDFTPFFYYHGDWYFSRYFNAEAYKIEKSGIKPAYLWDFGKLQYDSEKVKFTTTWQEDPYNPQKLFAEIESKCPYRIFGQRQNNKYIIAKIKLNGKLANLIFDKEKQKCILIDKFAESVGINPYLMTNEYMLTYSNPEGLGNYITEDMLDERNKEILKEVLSPDANPVIIKYTFK